MRTFYYNQIYKNIFINISEKFDDAVKNHNSKIVRILLDYDLIAIYKNNDLSDIEYCIIFNIR